MPDRELWLELRRHFRAIDKAITEYIGAEEACHPKAPKEVENLYTTTGKQVLELNVRN